MGPGASVIGGGYQVNDEGGTVVNTGVTITRSRATGDGFTWMVTGTNETADPLRIRIQVICAIVQ